MDLVVFSVGGSFFIVLFIFKWVFKVYLSRYLSYIKDIYKIYLRKEKFLKLYLNLR